MSGLEDYASSGKSVGGFGSNRRHNMLRSPCYQWFQRHQAAPRPFTFSEWVFLGRVHGLGVEAVIDISPYRPPCFSWSLCIEAPVKWAFRAFVGDRFPYARHNSTRSVCRAVIGPMGESYPQIPPKTLLRLC
jgi:hypothetical protein